MPDRPREAKPGPPLGGDDKTIFPQGCEISFNPPSAKSSLRSKGSGFRSRALSGGPSGLNPQSMTEDELEQKKIL